MPEADFRIANKDDPNSLIRGLLDLYILDQLISEEIVLACSIFHQYVKKYEREIVKIIEDETEEQEARQIKKERQWKRDIENIFTELAEKQRNTQTLQFYSVKLDNTWWLTTYTDQWNSNDIIETIRDMCGNVSENVWKKLEHITQKLESLPTTQQYFYTIWFYITSWRELRIGLKWYKWWGGKKLFDYDKPLSRNTKEIIILLQNIGYQDNTSSIRTTLQMDLPDDDFETSR